MIIIVDINESTADKNSRAEKEKYVKLLQKSFSNVISANTKIDVQVRLGNGENLAIERKNPFDFLASIADGRLERQIEYMHSKAKFVAVIVTGKLNWANEYVYADEEKTNWKSVSVRGMVRTIMLSGTMIDYCPPSRYAEQINEIIQTCSRDHGRMFIKRRIVTFPPLDERVQILANFPGISVTLAERVLIWAKVMNGDKSKADDYASLASTLHWISIMTQIDKASRPTGWGTAKILTVRKMLGLSSNEYIGVNSE